MTSHAPKERKGPSTSPYSAPLESPGLALLAVAGETVTDLLEPWPLKIVLDTCFQSKKQPTWLKRGGRLLGTDKLAVLNFAVLAVAVIAVVGALSSYLEKYLTTKRWPMVMHGPAPHALSHIHALSLEPSTTEKDRLTSSSGRVDERYRSHPVVHHHGALGIHDNVPHPWWDRRDHALPQLAFSRFISLAVAPFLFAQSTFFTRAHQKSLGATGKEKTEASFGVALVEEVSPRSALQGLLPAGLRGEALRAPEPENVETALVREMSRRNSRLVVRRLSWRQTC